MPRIGGRTNMGPAIFMILLIAVIGLYLASNLLVKDAAGNLDLDITKYKDTNTLTVLKIAVIGIAVFGAYALFIKLSGGAMSQRDYFTMAVIGVLIFLLWDKILVNLFSGKPLDQITFAVGRKLGMFP